MTASQVRALVLWILTFIFLGIGFGFMYADRTPAAPPPKPETSAAFVSPVASLVAPAPSAPSFFDDFDVKKKDREIEWCLDHGGLPAMTFTREHSNVLCLRPEAVIKLPATTEEK